MCGNSAAHNERNANMNKTAIICATAIVGLAAFAQDTPQKPDRNRPPARQFQGFGPNAGMWIPKMFSDKEALARIGVDDEAVAEKVAAALSALEARGEEIESKIRELSREQAKLFRSLLKDKNADPKPVTDLIDKIAELRAEQGRISVEAMIALRDSLTEEQMQKAFEFVRERGAERHRMRAGGDGGEPPFAMPRKPRDGTAPKDQRVPRVQRTGMTDAIPRQPF